MMERGTWIWLVEIEGLGRRASASYAPMALTSVPDPGEVAFVNDDGRSCDVWQNVLQTGLRLSVMTFAPMSATPGAQTLSFSLAMPDDLPEIAEFFVSDDLDPSPVALLTAPVDPTDTTINVTDSSAISPGDVVYCGAECWKVASVPDGTSFTILNQMPASQIWPTSRLSDLVPRSTDGAVGRIGHIGSRIAQHNLSASTDPPPFLDNRVYLVNPRIKGRRVYLRRVSWGLTPEGNYAYREQLIGQFVITDAPIGSNGTTIDVSATSAVMSYKDAQLGARGVQDRVAVQASIIGNPVAVVEYDAAFDDASRRIWPKGCGRYFWANGETVVQGADRTTLRPGSAFVVTSIGQRLLGGRPMEQQNREGTPGVTGDAAIRATLKFTPVSEVLVSDPLDLQLGPAEALIEFDPVNHPYYSTDKPGGAGILTHPLHLLLAHLGQLASNLPFHWQIRLSASEVDTAGVLALAEGPLAVIPRWPGVAQVGPVQAMEWLAKTFLQPIGCGWVTDQYGRLSVASLTAPKLGPWSAPNIGTGSASYNTVDGTMLQPGRAVDLDLDSAAGTVVSTTGQGIGKAPTVTIYSDDGYRVPDGDPQNATFQIDARGALSADLVSVDVDTVDSIVGVRVLTSSIGSFLRKGRRVYSLRVPSGLPEEDLALEAQPTLGPAMPTRYALPGSLVRVQAAGLRGVAGTLRGCIVMSHQWSDDCASQILQVMDVGASVRIAAAVLVVSATDNEDGTMSVVIAPDDQVTPTPYTAEPFGILTEDGQAMAAFAESVGDYEFVDWTDGTLAVVGDGPAQIVSYNVGTNTLLVQFSGSTYVPSAGDFGVLSTLGTNDVDEFFAHFGRDRFTI